MDFTDTTVSELRQLSPGFIDSRWQRRSYKEISYIGITRFSYGVILSQTRFKENKCMFIAMNYHLITSASKRLLLIFWFL